MNTTRINVLIDKIQNSIAWELKIEWEHLFRTILKWFRRTFDTCGLRTTQRGKQRKKLILPIIIHHGVSHVKRNYSLTLDNFSLSSQNLVLNCFLYPCKCADIHLREILAQFWPNKHSSATGRHFVRWNIFGSYALHTDPKSEAILSVSQSVCLRTRRHVTDLREFL